MNSVIFHVMCIVLPLSCLAGTTSQNSCPEPSSPSLATPFVTKDTTGLFRRNGFLMRWLLTDPEFERGQLNVALSIPWINNFYYKPEDEGQQRNTGFWGAAAGFEYFYNDRRYIGLGAHAVTDLFTPVAGAVDLYGEGASMYSLYFVLTNNHVWKRFHIGYGLCYAKNIWAWKYHGDDGSGLPPTRDPVTKHTHAIGASLNGYVQVAGPFYMGLIYRPTVFKLKPVAKTEYEHLLSLDFRVRLRVKK